MLSGGGDGLNTAAFKTPVRNRLLIFGGQALNFDGHSFVELRSYVHRIRQKKWVVEVLKSLPRAWQAFAAVFPTYTDAATGSSQLLAHLAAWFHTSSEGFEQFGASIGAQIPNIILSPLVVLIHLAEYLDRDPAEIRAHGARAVRLAILIGGIVNAQGRLNAAGPGQALVTSWATPDIENVLKGVLRQHPKSYISVQFDKARATRDLRAAGIVVSEIGLHGRFHHGYYNSQLQPFVRYFDADPDLRLPDASALRCATWSTANDGSETGSLRISRGPLHAHALQGILAHTCRWHQAFSAAVAASAPGPAAGLEVITFGSKRCVPPSAIRKPDFRAAHASEIVALRARSAPEAAAAAAAAAAATAAPLGSKRPSARSEEDVAVIGMSIKVAGADDVDDFWDLLCRGSSQHREVPHDRVSFDNVWREKSESMEPDRKWFGNFINDHNAFDHKFFKKSAREVVSTDPQQRHMLQVAYQAVEQSGYFGVGDAVDKKIGCFVGPNAFTAIGNLKSFIAGKISHYFGWLGPSLCIDTACSSSLVAVHQACRAVLSGECTAALAGGANIMTNSLCPTGQCKPFDASADGYCRGKGFAAVLILGTIAASRVYQNQNCTPVFVPNAPSLSDLFRDVIKQSRLEPRQITVVEAHGTGTQVGDPAEYQSVSDVLGSGGKRAMPLALGSVKGLVGHTEYASGAMVPPQASHDTMNPSIHASPESDIEIIKQLKPWATHDGLHTALINNYGASGSNASMPYQGRMEYPVRIYGADVRALRAYCSRLSRFLTDSSARHIANSLVLSCTDTDQLVQRLDSFAEGAPGSEAAVMSKARNSPRPVILCFGGQVSTSVGLDHGIYDVSRILRTHLAACNAVCESLPGVGSIFPAIFQRTPIDDQYACAQTVVGHSFGKLVVMCVSAERAALVRDCWGDLETDATIACYNGPRSFTLAGTSSEMDAVTKTLTEPGFSGMRSKRLSVTNAFHSTLVKPLLPRLADIGRRITFNEPRIPFKRATKARSADSRNFNASYIAHHIRDPVYFGPAIKRLAHQHPSGCIFLEAGSNSTNSYFQALNISGDNGSSRQNLTNATISLWKEGLPTAFWPHHRLQTYGYAPLLLPPYQFDKSRHWLEIKDPLRKGVSDGTTPELTNKTASLGLFSFSGNKNGDQRLPSFRINTHTEDYKELVSGHIITNTAAICPATLIIDMAIEALTSVRPDLLPSRGSWLPRAVILNINTATADDRLWKWDITSSSLEKVGTGKTELLHVKGQLVFATADDANLQAEIKCYERLTGCYQHCAEILDGSSADDIIHGSRNIYRSFSEVVDYPEPYRGVQRLISKDNESAGYVVAGIWVNCMTDCDPGDIYIAVGFKKWIRFPAATGEGKEGASTWDVLARYKRVSDKLFLSNIFVFDSVTGRLEDAILGINYYRISKQSIRKTLARMSPGATVPVKTPSSNIDTSSAPASRGPSAVEASTIRPEVDIIGQLRLILTDILGLEPAEISDNIRLADIGIDSLMGMELGRKMEAAFKTLLISNELACVVTFSELITYVSGVLGVSAPARDQNVLSGSSGSASDGGSTDNNKSLSSGLPSISVSSPADGELTLTPAAVFGAFKETKRLTDDFIANYQCADYIETVLPEQTQLCTALVVEACEQLGLGLKLLDQNARLIDVNPSTLRITRTSIALPAKHSTRILTNLESNFPNHSQLANVIRGNQDGIKLIFGTDEGRRLVTGLYSNSLLNSLAGAQIRDMPLDGPLRITELGAGTGGTTKDIIAMLAKLGVPVEYTFTDLSGSFVATARKKFGADYPFIKFRVQDIEKPPPAGVPLQHVLSAANIRKALRPDGVLLMLEITEPLHWADLQAVGYGRVDWTDGWRPEASAQPGFSLLPTPIAFPAPSKVLAALTETQEAKLDKYVRHYTRGFDIPSLFNEYAAANNLESSGRALALACVTVTGATGSLGAHLVAHLASLPHVKTVFCLNKRSTIGMPEERQQAAFSSRGIPMAPAAMLKLEVLVINALKPHLGLDAELYQALAREVTHIVHNAWPITGKRPVEGLKPQFAAMRNLIDLARDAAVAADPRPRRRGPVAFQFVLSIAVVGRYPLLPGGGRVAPERRALGAQLLPNGYAQAKWVCERMLDATLYRRRNLFRACAVRPGQIAGSAASGYWNADEHLAFLVKSSQTLRALPRLRGDVCWTPVDRVAGALADLLLEPEPGPVYYVDNPLGLAHENIISFEEWVRRVKMFPGSAEDNPAARLIDFLDDNFLRMSCGGLLLDTAEACKHSPTLRSTGPVSDDIIRAYIRSWRARGFLY
ncbi:hypothetical protein GGR56DRAFT_686841 [Xylariaceae sp. FL0804]|nr:hypothetical protein GGR56DRAFT_686841 [Xylariaceae sp. FL0804]